MSSVSPATGAYSAQVLCCVVLAAGIVVLFALVLIRRPLDIAATPLFLPDQSPWGEIAVAVCDVNDLEVVNDTQGHRAGDDFLRAKSALIAAAFPERPLYRVGGDEFVVLLQGRAFELREELLRLFEEANEERQCTGGVVIAVGVSAWRADKDDTLSVVYSRADAIMYQRKRELKAMGGEVRPARGAGRRLRGRSRTSGEDS